MFDYSLPYDSRRSPVFGRNMVATSQPLAAQAGLQVLLAGGNAVDAAVAAAAVLTVVEPTNNGVGGDAFAIVWDGSVLHGLNASGRSPAAWTRERFLSMGGIPQRGWNVVTVPGAVSAWVELTARFGSRTLSQNLSAAASLADGGFHVTPGIAAAWARGAAQFVGYPGFDEHFLPGGKPPAAGQVFRNPALSATLAQIGETDGEAFYRGALASRIAQACQQNGGVMTVDDLASHRADWCGTLSADFLGSRLHEIPPNGQGIAALMAVSMLRHTAIADHHPDSPQAIHLMVEALKLAFADVEAHVADPAFMAFDAGLLLDGDYLEQRARSIDPTRAQTAAAGAPTQGGTVYLTVADASGMMVSYIQSNFGGFGAGVAVPGTGIHMQNRGTGFTMTEGHPNCVGPSKRPFHTIIPGFATKDGKPLMSFGVMGGPVQAQGHVQMLVRCHLHGQNPQAAIDAPRFRFVKGLTVALEGGVPAPTITALADMGHAVSVEEQRDTFAFGGAQIIAAIEGGYVGGSDSRRDGLVAGF